MSHERVSMLTIGTPEGVTFSLPLAGPFTRSLAYFIDLAAMLAFFNIFSIVFQMLRLMGDIGMGLTILIQFAFINSACMLSELLWQGKTPGKKVLGLRVIDEHGLKLRPEQVIIRNLLRFVDALPVFYALGGTVALFSSRSQRLGDLAAGTVVVRTIKSTPPDVENLLSGKFNSFRDHPHLEARLRQKVSAEEAQLALQALIRRDELEADARVRLYEGVASQFREKVQFPEEAIFGLSNEQYVRNVVETVFRKRQ
jgi:uncharacterized RDD family membrane protein YckC